MMRDAQADVPSTEWLRAQLAFKNSMVHGILQFTPSIAFCYVLHRCVSRDIRCRESFMIKKRPHTMSTPQMGHHGKGPSVFSFPWHMLCRGLLFGQCDVHEGPMGKHEHTSTRLYKDRGKSINPRKSMLLLQVHKSFCYAGFDNDPSAGSPTETLLRLLLPLNDKVQWNSRDVAGSEPPTSPRS